MVENIKIKPVKKLIGNLDNFLNIKLADNDIKGHYDKAKVDVDTFLEKGTDIFYRKEVIFGEEELIEVKLEQSLGNVTFLKLSNAIISFNTEPSSDNFTELCNAYFFDLLTYISVSKNLKESSVLFLDSDISLLYIFTLIYFPEKTDKIEPFIIKGLDYRKRVWDNNIREMKGSYGRDSVLYLAYWLANEYKRDDEVIKELMNFCNDTIEPAYIFVLENIFSKDNDIIIKCINKMADYHIKKSNLSDLTCSFHTNQWIYFPIEILALLQIRKIKDFDNHFISHPLIDVFMSFYQQKISLNRYLIDIYERLID